MKKEKVNGLRITSGIFFAIYAIYLFYLYEFTIYDWLVVCEIAGPLILAIAMFTGIPFLTVIGCVSCIVYLAKLLLFNYVGELFSAFDFNILELCAQIFAEVLCYLLIIIADCTSKKRKRLGVVGAVFWVVSFCCCIIRINGHINISTIILYVITLVALLLFALSEDSGANSSLNNTQTPKSINEAPDITIERLSRLKDLLDKGILTQEEFDAKKKDILG